MCKQTSIMSLFWVTVQPLFHKINQQRRALTHCDAGVWKWSERQDGS